MPGGAQNGPVNEDRIKEEFKRRDVNGDGKLQVEEMSSSLRAEWEKWDKDKNGTIEYEEYKEYYLSRTQQFGRDQNGGFDRRGQNGQQGGFDEFQPPQSEEVKHVVYRRVEDLPKELPQFFFTIQHRSVGQIALYEWKNAGMTLDEFRKYDRNSDGFITVEEVLGYQKKNGTADRRGNRGQQQEEEQTQEEKLLVLAGPGAVSEDTPLNVVMADSRGGSQNGGFNRGGMNRGGFDPNSMKNGNSRGGFPTGGFPTGGMPTGMDRGSRGGFPTGGMPTGMDRSKSRDNQPSGNNDRGSKGQRPGR
jgi:Ca2+-binding EF-hand superfamily protein